MIKNNSYKSNKNIELISILKNQNRNQYGQ